MNENESDQIFNINSINNNPITSRITFQSINLISNTPNNSNNSINNSNTSNELKLELIQKLTLFQTLSLNYKIIFTLFFLSLLIPRHINHFSTLKENFLLDYLNGLCIIPFLYYESFLYSKKSIFMIIPYVY